MQKNGLSFAGLNSGKHKQMTQISKTKQRCLPSQEGGKQNNAHNEVKLITKIMVPGLL